MSETTGLLDALRSARHVAVLTGAGVSAESGIPTFRDRQTGLWERFDALELATPEAFNRDPSLVWGWYEWRRMQVRRAKPNPAHLALAELEQRIPRLTLITQNVDDLHERAGSRAVLHLHGRLFDSRCADCGLSCSPSGAEVPPEGARIEPPTCSACGGWVRPGVVWFGESLPKAEWRAAAEAAAGCDVFFVIGTSAVVQPAASLAVRASEAGARTVQINPHATELDAELDDVLRGPAGVLLPRLLLEL